jgi:hypothetical protein
MRRFSHVWARLFRASREFFAQTGLRLSPDGLAEFSWLLTKATVTILQDDKAEDAEALQAAEAAVHTLLATAGGMAGATSTVGPAPIQPLALYLPGSFLFADPGGGKRSISRADLREALQKLCPIWPFCRRPQAAIAR